MSAEPASIDDLDLLEDGGYLAKRLGRYELCFELASGGMATVYLARMIAPDDASLERLVALKLIHRHLAKQEEFREMFLDEARIASRINHPNVCTVYDYGEIRGVCYIAMELLEGESLHAIVRSVAKMPKEQRPPLWPAYCARIIADAAEGLHAAHELTGARGELLEVVHRDVSPQNLFVGYDGSVRVVDFGIARASDKNHQTATGTLKGKFAYMAPEQIVSRAVDRRLDIWALGVVLWELLTRKRLFRRETEFLMVDAVRTMDIPPPSTINPELPEELDDIVMGALQRTVSKRYATARDLSRELRKFLMTLDEPIEMAEIAEFMRSTFAEAYASRKTLTDIAQAGATRSVPQAGLRLGGESSDTHNAITAILTRARAALPPVDAETDIIERDEATATLADLESGSREIPLPEPPAQEPAADVAVSKPVGALVGLLALLVCVLLGALVAILVWPSEPAPVARSTPAPAPALPSIAPPTPPPATPIAQPEPEPEPQPEPEPEPETTPEPAVERRRPRSSTPRRRRSSPAATGTGQVFVSSSPWATILSAGGQPLGQTPTTLTLPAGRQTLVLRAQGTGTVRTGTARRVTVTVEPNQRVTRHVRF